VLKIDLLNAFDRVKWSFIRLLLMHLGFEVPFIRWIMACISSVTFAVLINGTASPFLTSERGIRKGFPLSPQLFLLVADDLSRALISAKNMGDFKGIKTSPNFIITHLLFVDYVLIFCSGRPRDAKTLAKIL
jgi:hypothetical protein